MMATEAAQNPRYHTQKVQAQLDALIKHLRQDVKQVDEPQAQALFEISAEVLEGLKQAYIHYEQKSEPAWQ